MPYSETLSGKNKDSDLETTLITIKEKLDSLKKDILKNKDSYKKNFLESLENDTNITDKVGFILCYDFDSHLLLGDRGFGILHIDSTTNQVDIEKTFRINSETYPETYDKIMQTLGDIYESFTIVNGDRMFSVQGTIRLDISSGKILFSSQENITPELHQQLDALGIQDHIVFYDKKFITDIIDHGQQLNVIIDMDKTGTPENEIHKAIQELTQDEPIVLSITPAENTNQASKYNNMDILTKEYTILYFQISNETGFKEVLDQMMVLKKYGVQIDNFYFQEHADKDKIFLSVSGRKDKDILSYNDLEDLTPDTQVFEGTNIIMDTCLAGKGLSDKHNITDFLAQSLFLHAKTINSPTKPVYSIFVPPKPGKKPNFNEFIYYEESADAQTGIHKLLLPNEIYNITKE